MHCHCRRRGDPSRSGPRAPVAVCTASVVPARCGIRLTCSPNVGAYHSGIGVCPAHSVCIYSPVCDCCLADTPSVSTRLSVGSYGLRDEQVFRWRLDGTIRGPDLQYSFSILAISSMALSSPCSAIPEMDDPGNCRPSRDSNHPPRDGNILRHEPCHPPFTSSILRDRVLDWFFDQHTRDRSLASITDREISNRKNGDCSFA